MATGYRARFAATVAASLGVSSATGIAATQPAFDPIEWRLAATRAASASAGAIEDPYRAGEVFATIARAQAAIGDVAGAEASLREALAKAPSIPQAEFRGWVQHEIVQAQLAVDDVIGARQTAEAIAATRPHGAAYVLLARRSLHAGNAQAAEALALAIRDAGAAGEILAELVAVAATRGDIAAARALQRRIDDRFYAASARAYVAIAEGRSGKFEQARATVMSAPRAQRDQSIGPLVAWLIERGETSRALELANEIDDADHRAMVLGRLALDSQRNGNAQRARELFIAASTVQQRSRAPPRRQLSTLIQIARLQSLAGFETDARTALQAARQQGASLQASDRDAVLEAIARAYLRLSDFNSALSTAAGIQDRISRALLIRDAIALREATRVPTASGVDDSFVDPLSAAAAQFGVLASRIGRADSTSILQAIAAARERVAHLDDPSLPPAAFAALAAACVNAGDPQLGAAVFLQAQRAAAQLERPEQRALAYVRIANALNDRLMFLGRPANPADACAADGADCDAR